ncbi:MAG: thiamine diphosphokinase [Actinomycetota bacterium]
MSGTALIVAGGARPDPLVVNALPRVDFCVAADSGADNALAVGLAVDAVVGDMDSISADTLNTLRLRDVEMEEHPTRKDSTDLELAMVRALAEKPERLMVIGIGGGRLDHELANMAVLASEETGTVRVEGLVGSARVTVIRGSMAITGVLGETVSLLPVLGDAEGVTTEGLEYELTDEPLLATTARGVSNRFVAREAKVSVRRGVLLAIQPHGLKVRSTG